MDARRGMAGERPSDALRSGDPLSAGSSTRWTDEKHLLYISSLELSFVTQLYDGEISSNGLLCWSPSVWRNKTHNGNHANTQVDQQVYWGMVEADGAESRVSQVEHTGPPSYYGDQEDRNAYYMNDDASTSEPRQERISHYARRKNSGGSSTSHFHLHGHSLFGTELSDQNFVDDETEVIRERSRECSNKRLKHGAHTTNSLAATSANANLQLEVIHHVEVDYSGSSSEFEVGLLKAEASSCESQGQRRWSV